MIVATVLVRGATGERDDAERGVAAPGVGITSP